jgi:glucose-6-phosphate 1-epimerase
MTPQTLADLQRDFPLPGARFERGPADLPVLVVDNDACGARVFPYGGHVAAWAPAGQAPVLFMSDRFTNETGVFVAGKAIRGGVPVCFPWFGARRDDPKPDGRPSPAHGFARTRSWRVDDVSVEDNGSIGVALTLAADDETRASWDAPFEASLLVSLGPTLSIDLEVRNLGDAEIAYEAALHTYVAVGDVERAALHGLERARFFDKVEGSVEQAVKQAGADPLVLTGETDRVFQGTRSAVVVDDPVLRRHVRVEKSGSLTTVVWNPWLVKAQAMPDLGGEAWRRFVCVEAANTGSNAVVLPGRAVHRLGTRLSVIPQRG